MVGARQQRTCTERAPEGQSGTLLSVLLPVPPATSQGTVAVRATSTAGLPD
ncbi:hypothetical protein NKG05_21155 [Oerskovia sp. M15]